MTQTIIGHRPAPTKRTFTARALGRAARPVGLAVAITLAAGELGACTNDTQYYAEQCARKGVATGTAAYDDCVKREAAALNAERERMKRVGGGRPG